MLQADYGGTASIDYLYDANCNLLQRTVTTVGEVSYTLVYRAGTGGTIDGYPVITQQVGAGRNAAAVSPEEEAGAVFAGWSDGVATAARTDNRVEANLDVTARFRSTGGADLYWYATHGIAPEPDETWAEVDDRPVPAKGTTLRQENISDTNPDDPADIFRMHQSDPGPQSVIPFRPGSPKRLYRLRTHTNLVNDIWTSVPDAGPRPGSGQATDALIDTNAPPVGTFYRIEVDLP